MMDETICQVGAYLRIEAGKEGNGMLAAPQQLVEEYGDRLFGLCMHLCRQRDTAEELYQETWVRVLMKQGSFRDGEPFEPWLTKICVNLYRDSLRRQRLRRFLPLSGLEAAEVPLQISDDERLSLLDAVGRLPEKLRLAVILVYMQGYTERQAGEILGISVNGVKSRLLRARKLLKEALTDE